MKPKLPRISKAGYILRMAVIALALITPIIFLATEGYLPSLSNYWRTPLQPLFILANASTAYYFFGFHNRWRIPAVFLLLLTAFSIDSYPMVHNVVAVLFFVSCLIPLHKTKYYKHFFWAYICSILFVPISVTLGEFLSTSVLCVFHALMIHKIYKVQKK